MTKKIITIEHYILFDIDSTSIGGGIVRYGKNEKGEILEATFLFSTRENITNGTEYPFENFFHRTLEILKSVANKVYVQSLVPLDGIYINVSVPWMSAQKRIINYKKEKTFVYNQALVDELVEKEIEASLGSNLNYVEHDVDLISKRTMDIYANGYLLRNPVGKEMNDLSIHSLMSIISRMTKEKFTEVIESIFHRTPEFLSNTFINYQAVKTFLPNTDDAIVIDISGEVTEVLVIQKDHLIHIGSIPVGTHHIARSLRDNLNISINKAHSLISLHTKGSLDPSYKESLENAMYTAFRTWFKSFYTLLDSYGRHGLLPHTIVLKTNNDNIQWCREYLIKEDSLREHIVTNSRIEIILLADVFPHGIFDDFELGILSQLIYQLR